MQTILGSGGAIGTELAKALTAYTTDIRLVSRQPKKVNPGDALLPADLTKPENVATAIAGSEVVYVTVGFAYSTPVWQQYWLPLVQAVTAACEQQGAKLVFFDNVYAIGKGNTHHITEASPISPTSKKGTIRAAVDQHILQRIESGKLNAIIARAPDFFGAKKETSMLMNLAYDNLIKGKKAQWLCNAKVPHTMGYAPEMGKGTAMLGNTPDAYNQIWNLPTDREAWSGERWVHEMATIMGKSDGVQVLPDWMAGVIGWFVPIMKELREMNYQFAEPYYFDSSKFSKRFNYEPMSNRAALEETLRILAG
ncbi:MAG: NAD-dependent epimerase/dehydratase family protein [Chitinophagales bacterium]